MSLILLWGTRAYAVVGATGSTWGRGSSDLGKLEGAGVMGYIEQGVDWMKLPQDVQLRSFMNYRWRLRSLNERFYNMQGVSAGTELQKSGFRLGTQYTHSYFTEINEHTDTTEFYLSSYFQKDLSVWTGRRLLGLNVIGLPLTSWSFHWIEFTQIEGNGSMGFVQQGIDWWQGPWNLKWQTYTAYHWRFRSKNRPFFNTQGPSVGSSIRNKMIETGYEYSWKNYPELHRTDGTNEIYLSWYFDWDLMKRS